MCYVLVQGCTTEISCRAKFVLQYPGAQTGSCSYSFKGCFFNKANKLNALTFVHLRAELKASVGHIQVFKFHFTEHRDERTRLWRRPRQQRQHHRRRTATAWPCLQPTRTWSATPLPAIRICRRGFSTSSFKGLDNRKSQTCQWAKGERLGNRYFYYNYFLHLRGAFTVLYCVF